MYLINIITENMEKVLITDKDNIRNTVMKKIIETIFSVKNKNCYKVITILGIKFKFKNYSSEIIKNTTELNNKIESLSQNIINGTKDNKNKFEELKKILLTGSNNQQEKIFKNKPLNISVIDEVQKNEECPYCKSKKFFPIRDFKINNLISEYSLYYGIDPIGDKLMDCILEKNHCANCDLEFYNYIIPDSKILYEKLLESGKYVYGKYKWDYTIAIDTILKYDCKKVLDIGCGYGYFLEQIKNITDYAMGAEFNAKALEVCTQKNLNVTNKSIDEIEKKFDLVCLFQVLEHIAAPKDFIQSALNLVENDGFLLIITPNPKGFWCDSPNPGVLNLPPHHCLDVTKEFFFNLEKDFNVKVLEYHKDTPEFGLYKKVYKFAHTDNLISSYLTNKDNLIGHRHGVVLKKY